MIADPFVRIAEPVVALDVDNLAAARDLVRTLGDSCDFYKVGLELFTSEGPHVVSWLRSEGKRVFLDLKLHDIPNTVQGAARSAARMGVNLLTVHASGGSEMIRAAVDGFRDHASAAGAHDGILAVTILTSLDATALAHIWGRNNVDTQAEVIRLAQLAAEVKAVGIVCSGHEVRAVRDVFGATLWPLVPGIRLSGGVTHDQARVATPAQAVRDGARWLVLGRAVTAAPDPVAAMQQVREEIEQGVPSV